VWTTCTQYYATNNIIVDDSFERVKENPKENVILDTSFDGKNWYAKWFITDLWRILNQLYNASYVQNILKDVP